MTNFVFRVVANVVNSAAWAANGLLEVMYPKDLYVPAVASGGPAAPCADPHPAGAADPAAGEPSPPGDPVAGSLSWFGWTYPCVVEVLAEHGRWWDNEGCCRCGTYIHDEYGWHDHVADLIAERIACDPARAIAALQQLVKQ